MIGCFRQNIIDPPANIVFARTAELTPPGVVSLLLRILIAEGINPPCLLPTRQLLPLFWQKAAGFNIRFRSGQINGMMSCVVIAHHQYRPGLALLFYSIKYCSIKVHFVGHPAVVTIFATALWEIYAGDRQTPKLCQQKTSLIVKP